MKAGKKAVHCWLCETLIRRAPGGGFYCPNPECKACKDDAPRPLPRLIDAAKAAPLWRALRKI